MRNSLLKELYFALVQSVLEYGLCLFGCADSTAMTNIKTVKQIALLKLSTGKRGDSQQKV